MTREEAVDILRSYLMFDKSNMQIDIALNMAIEALHREEAEEKGYCHRIRPSNVEVVVRCKDCRWHHTSRKSGRQICAHQNGLVYAADNSFCSHAERRLK